MENNDKPHAGREEVMAKRAAFELLEENSHLLFKASVDMALDLLTPEEYRNQLAAMLATLLVAGEVGLMGEEEDFQVLLNAQLKAMQPRFPCVDLSLIMDDLVDGPPAS